MLIQLKNIDKHFLNGVFFDGIETCRLLTANCLLPTADYAQRTQAPPKNTNPAPPT